MTQVYTVLIYACIGLLVCTWYPIGYLTFLYACKCVDSEGKIDEGDARIGLLFAIIGPFVLVFAAPFIVGPKTLKGVVEWANQNKGDKQ